jgi:hypothetical protein
MKITDALRDRAQLAQLLDPASSIYVEGSEESRKEAREAWHRHRFVGQVMSSSLEELPRSDLSFGRFGIVEHVPTGRLFRLRRDGLIDLEFVPNAVAFYCDETGLPILLEPAPGAATRAEAEQRQAAREARRNQPRPKPSWMR